MIYRILISLCFIFLAFNIVISAQTTSASVKNAERDFAAEREMADLAIKAHGGDKLLKMSSLTIRGSADINIQARSFPVTFVTIFSGEKYRFELNNPFQPIKQVSDGTATSSSMGGGFSLPPVNRIGFPVLQKIGQPGFIITALPEKSGKKKGFRLTSPEGYVTDFFVDSKTGQIKGYESMYETNGRKISTSVAIDKMRLVDGVLVPEKYAQRFDMDQFTVYADFKAKDILVNEKIEDNVFLDLS